MNNISIGEKITRLRRVCGLTQKELAQKVGLTASTITKYEKGLLEPNIGTLQNISKTLNVNISALIDNDDFKNAISNLNYFDKFIKSLGFNVWGRETEAVTEIWIRTPNNQRLVISGKAYKKLKNDIEEFAYFKINQLVEKEKQIIGEDLFDKINHSIDVDDIKFRELSKELHKALNKK